MITVLFGALLLLSVTVAMTDWRRGWLLAIVCGVLQDPARKLTPGTPVVMTMSIVLVYAMVLVSAQSTLQDHAREFSRRFSAIKVCAALVFLFLILAAVNGLATFGLANWKAPALAAIVYCAPIPAVLLGFAYLRREEQMFQFFRFYAVLTSVAMIGTFLEYFNVPWRVLGTVALSEFNLRYLPGLEIRMLSGFYRAPDIMGWHAATLTIIGIIMTLRARVVQVAWPWMLVTAWGFLNCLMSGRRKATYMVAVFAAAFLFRYIRRLTTTQITTIALAGLALFFVVHKVGQDEDASVYTRGTVTTTSEVFERLEGGLVGTVEQFGLMGAGLGTATQGVYHVVNNPELLIGWQEGGLGKLTMELGLPGLFAVALFAVAVFSFMLKITRHPDVVGSSQFLRATLFGIVVADVVGFFVSAQAYSDAGLALLSAFFLGCLFASALLDERLEKSAPAQVIPPLPIHQVQTPDASY
jgi:hypothetical protein